MIALRKQIGQYTNDLVSMHTNVSTILTRLCGLKVPLRQSFAQDCVKCIYYYGGVSLSYDHIIF